MDKLKKLNDAHNNIDEFSEALGNAIYEAFMEDDNYLHEIGRSVLWAFNSCKTESEVEIADRMLIAICGWGIETLLRRIEGDE